MGNKQQVPSPEPEVKQDKPDPPSQENIEQPVVLNEQEAKDALKLLELCMEDHKMIKNDDVKSLILKFEEMPTQRRMKSLLEPDKDFSGQTVAH